MKSKQNNKGITPIIAVILLLLITIAIVGFAFLWFNRLTSSATNFTEAELRGLQQTSSKKASIDSIDITNAAVSIRNRGTLNIPISELTVYVNGALQTGCSWTPAACSGGSGALAVASVCTCDWSAGNCTANTVIKVTSPGTTDERTC